MDVKVLASFIKRTESASHKKLEAMKKRVNTHDSAQIIKLNDVMLSSNQELQSISNDILHAPVDEFIDKMSKMDKSKTEEISDTLTKFSHSLNSLSSKIIEVKKTFELDDLEKKIGDLSMEIDVFKIESRHLLDIEIDSSQNYSL